VWRLSVRPHYSLRATKGKLKCALREEGLAPCIAFGPRSLS